jgi:hypothetical protein
MLKEWHRRQFDEVVIEYILTLTNSKLNRELSEVGRMLFAAFPAAASVRPGQWKPVVGHLPVPDYGSKHTKDAMRLGLYWLRLNVSPHVRFTLESETSKRLP